MAKPTRGMLKILGRLQWAEANADRAPKAHGAFLKEAGSPRYALDYWRCQRAGLVCRRDRLTAAGKAALGVAHA